MSSHFHSSQKRFRLMHSLQFLASWESHSISLFPSIYAATYHLWAFWNINVFAFVTSGLSFISINPLTWFFLRVIQATIFIRDICFGCPCKPKTKNGASCLILTDANPNMLIVRVKVFATDPELAVSMRPLQPHEAPPVGAFSAEWKWIDDI